MKYCLYCLRVSFMNTKYLDHICSSFSHNASHILPPLFTLSHGEPPLFYASSPICAVHDLTDMKLSTGAQ